MGCDIHMISEKRDRAEYSQPAKWEPMLDPIFKDPYFRKDEAVSHYNCPYSFQPYDNRNYILFSILANVRNGQDIEPISEPRGLPDDMHQVSNWLLNEWDYIDHSETWLSLDEVLAFHWDSEFTRHGVVSLEEYKVFKENGKPNEWSAGVGGGNSMNISIEDMEGIISGDLPDLGRSYYTTVQWKDKFSDVCKDFLENMNLLKEYAERDDCDIRLIFGFDN